MEDHSLACSFFDLIIYAEALDKLFNNDQLIYLSNIIKTVQTYWWTHLDQAELPGTEATIGEIAHSMELYNRRCYFCQLIVNSNKKAKDSLELLFLSDSLNPRFKGANYGLKSSSHYHRIINKVRHWKKLWFSRSRSVLNCQFESGGKKRRI